MLVHMPDGRTLSAYHDGELSAGTAVEIGQHLERCTTCKEEYERLAKVANVVRHLHRSEAPVTLARAIRRRVDEELRGMVPILRDELLSCRRRPGLVPAVSLRENERGAQIGAGWNPHWHQPTDVFSTFSDKDFRLGLNAAQTTLGALGQLAGVTLKQ